MVYTRLDSNREYYTYIPDFPRYLLSSKGVVYRLKEGRMLRVKRKLNPDTGYIAVNLSNEEGQFTKSLHRLVGELFLYNDDPENKKVLDHIDCDKTNNGIDNLEWVTQSENIKRTWSDTRHTEEYKERKAKEKLEKSDMSEK